MTLIRRGLMMASAGGGGMYDLVLRNGQQDSTSLAFFNWAKELIIATGTGSANISEYNITLIFDDGSTYKPSRIYNAGMDFNNPTLIAFDCYDHQNDNGYGSGHVSPNGYCTLVMVD